MVNSTAHPDYEEVTRFLFSRLPVYQRTGSASYKIDLSVTQALDAYFGHPHRHYPTLHIAGTNGKGSVSHMLASVLQHAGYRTGLYTSPHLKDFRERIRINGTPVSEEYIVRFVREHHHLFDELSPSFFEITVAMAFQYFAEEQVDIAVIETGLGGRLDSTNIITPLCSVITNIGLDHTRFLGDTLPQIAAEKGGIIKERVPVVIGRTQPETAHVFRRIAADRRAPIRFADRHFRAVPLPASSWSCRRYRIEEEGEVRFPGLATDLPGDYQAENLQTVMQTLRLVENRFSVEDTTVLRGLAEASRTTGLLGRWQVLEEKPLIVADTGHNGDALRRLVRQISSIPHRQLIMVTGFVRDKDIRQLLALLPSRAHYIFTQAAIPRALEAEELHRLARQHGLQGEVVRPVAAAVKRARAMAGTEDMIFIGGSTFVVAEALP